MYISAADFNLIIDALSYAAERVLESHGDIAAFGDEYDNEYNMMLAESARELAMRLVADDEVTAYDHVLLKEIYHKDTGHYAVCDQLINELYYDDYGRLRKASYAIPTVDQLIKATKAAHTVPIDVFPRENIEEMLEFFNDLWLENELGGYNNPDGSFNHEKGKEAE